MSANTTKIYTDIDILKVIYILYIYIFTGA